jgi:small subunit ribosomal protein S4e
MVHITRNASPWFLLISKKQYKWTVRTVPGAHSLNQSVPLSILLRDYLQVAVTLKEAKTIISSGKVLVDGKIRLDYRFPVGLMDVISIPSADLYYRIIPDNARFLKAIEIPKEESTFKLVRILNKSLVKNGNLQLNLDSGRNIQISKDNTSEYKYSTLTTLKISLPNQEIIEAYELKEGNYGIIIGGKNAGRHGVIGKIQISPYKRRQYSIVNIQSKDGKTYESNLENIMAIGTTNPVIKVE